MLDTSRSGRTRVPKLTEDERKLLLQNQGCLKCCRVFVEHKMANCPVGFPDPSKYKTLTQGTVDAIKAHIGSKRKIGAVQRDSPEPKNVDVLEHPVAAVMGSTWDPVAYLPANKTSIIEDTED